MTIHSGLAPAGVCHLCASICTGLNPTRDPRSLPHPGDTTPVKIKLFCVHISARFWVWFLISLPLLWLVLRI